MIEYNTIANMKSATGIANGQLAYVKGYFAAGDGGGGMFIYNSTDTQADNKGVIFAPNSGSGRWIRQYEGYMNVEYFGVQKAWDFYGTTDPLFSNSERIQLMIDYAYSKRTGFGDSKSSDMTIYFPTGDYFIDKTITLKDEVRLLGSSSTILTNEKYNYDYMFKLDVGPVTKLRMEDFIINTNQLYTCGGLHIKAAFPTTSDPSGLWHGVFRNITIQNCKGTAIYLEGGEGNTATTSTSNWNLPNQMVVFDNVRAERMTATYPALKLTGQNANYTFLNCEFRNKQGLTLAGTCVEIKSVNSGTSYMERMATNAVSFVNSGGGAYSEYFATIEDSTNITFDTNFFEGLDTCFSIKNSQQIQIFNNRFANAIGSGFLDSGHTSTGNVGSLIAAEGSIINIWNNHITSSGSNTSAIVNQYFITGTGNNNVFNVLNNSFSHPELSKTTGVLQTVSVDVAYAANNTTHGTLHTSSKKLVFATVPASPLSIVSKIDSDICPGETVFIKASGGSIQFLPMNPTSEITGRNIYLNGRASLTINNGQGVTFMKADNVSGNEKCAYHLVSIAN
ncbi:hypothetical protein HYN59_07155 [Flavobacterium album]|uniref:Rhamnogalacturonase A/B/Epimerase-like pectate lyase domain-containing protein n=1 Tax=Flavobacterium album TaxID=2175091 RepID=A0A2S1QWY2_9FLAO|nr:glycosyl hydrolase family 28-related protein [Flavobacterium album]AWH84916.1 hypothetical protein HYN59_07155 [Flavobacterium album]